MIFLLIFILWTWNKYLGWKCPNIHVRDGSTSYLHKLVYLKLKFKMKIYSIFVLFSWVTNSFVKLDLFAKNNVSAQSNVKLKLQWRDLLLHLVSLSVEEPTQYISGGTYSVYQWKNLLSISVEEPTHYISGRTYSVYQWRNLLSISVEELTQYISGGTYSVYQWRKLLSISVEKLTQYISGGTYSVYQWRNLLSKSVEEPT